jgi:hypothetical protein
MKTKLQAELPISEESRGSSAVVEGPPVESPWSVAGWVVNEPSPHMSGAIIELGMQVTASREDLKEALAEGQARVDRLLADLEAKARECPEYQAWRRAVKSHEDKVPMLAEHTAALEAAMEGVLTSKPEEFMAAAGSAARQEALGLKLR